ncbi:L-lactate dehydrogenase complex protein LldE [Parvibaculum indicum]|uniref:(Fe-S)-binding protein n=1 Tax=Parvibaculum indicum TaxID=562969 RepID=UPI00141EC4D4|nr:(Fe-S)-binding protein [Parvibaculum indicum]NIJ43247.1 L-lactate dehydrogenase complex protein LldE [Parvibaculum indicum]
MAKVGLFVTCIVNTMRPEIGFASLKLLERAGFEAEVPRDQTCCGQPNMNGGDKAGAKEFACRLAKLYASYDYVVAPSGSCAGTIRTHYPDLFDEDDPDGVPVKELAAKTWELTSFLTEVAGLADVEASFDGALAYHDSCAGLRELKVKQQPRALLKTVRGLELKELPDAEVCCGFGGLFCVKYPDVSGEMVRKKVADIEATDAKAVAMGDAGCMLNIEGALARKGSDIKVWHVAEVLAGLAK